MLTFEDVVGRPENIMGVKAVWGYSAGSVMSFGGRGDPQTTAYDQQARRAAELAIEAPFLITIGGGGSVSDELRGRTLELLHLSGAFGRTNVFVKDPTLQEILQQWAVSVVVLEAYEIIGRPSITEDLQLAGPHLLDRAYDSVRRVPGDIERLWNSLRQYSVRLRENKLPQGFSAPSTATRYGKFYPTRAAEEGREIYEAAKKAERDRTLSRSAKIENRRRNGGLIICEACDFSDKDLRVFDAHHIRPISTGIRVSRLDDFAVLCPTCHRLAHCKSDDFSEPLTVGELRSLRSDPGGEQPL